MARRPTAEREIEADDDDQPKRRLNALAIVSLSLLALIGVLAGWLAITYEPGGDAERQPVGVVLTMPPPPEPEVAIAEAPPEGTPAPQDSAPATAEPAPPAAEPTGTPAGEAVASAAPSIADAAPAASTISGATPAEPDEPKQPERLAPAQAGAGTEIALGPAPDPALISEGPKGPLPVIGPDGRQPWRVYARPFKAGDDRPRIAVVLGGLGLSQSATNAAIQQLPGEVTLAFAAYASNLSDWIAEARAAGHEVMLQVPMEPFNYPASDPGPHTLLTSLTPEVNIDRLEWLLGRSTGYVGITNFLGSKFTASAEHLRPILQSLGERGLMILDGRTSRNSVAGPVSATLGIPHAVNNRFLDSEASRVAIDARLFELERIAKSTGSAVGVGSPFPVTIERIASWAATLDNKGIVLAPISAVATQGTSE